MANLEDVFGLIDKHQDRFVANLKEACAIKSVSAGPLCRPNIRKMVEWSKTRLEKLGYTCELIDTGVQDFGDGVTAEYPPCLTATPKNMDPKKKTVMLYGHVDVMPAEKADGWDSDPWDMIENEKGEMIGRGVTDDKGPVLGWMHAVECYQEAGLEIPVNVKFFLEGMEEQGSAGFKDTVARMGREKHAFFQGIDFIAISDSYWIGTKMPCLSYGLRGLTHFWVEVTCAGADLHSGQNGGVVNEAMSDLCWLMGQLVDANGKILVPGIQDEVRPVLEKEQKLYAGIKDYDWESRRQLIGTNKLTSETPVESLMATWRYPSLSIHGVSGAFSDPGLKTVIPAKVTGKFSIRIVPDMTQEGTQERVITYLNGLWAKRGSANDIKITPIVGGKWWIEDPEGDNYGAAARAVKKVFGKEPDMVREGGAIPVTIVMCEAIGANACLIPMGRCDDRPHGQNEKLDRSNYIEGTKTMAAYLWELAH